MRHPENVGIKNGKPYYYMPETAAADQNSTEPQSEPKPEKKRSGARIGHRGYHRPVPDHVDEERTVSITQCPYCWSDLSDSATTRTRTIEGIPEIKPTVIRYTIERRYCSRCKKMVGPEFREALPKATLSLRTMLVIAYMKTVERLPAARVSEMMDDIFNFHVTKGEVMHIIHQLSIHLGLHVMFCCGFNRSIKHALCPLQVSRIRKTHHACPHLHVFQVPFPEPHVILFP